MKVKVIKATRQTYWYANRLGQEFEVEPSLETNNPHFIYKTIFDDRTMYFNKNDVEIIQENVQMFDLKKEKWFIRTPTPEISKLVQEWLFEQGLVWQYHKDAIVRNTEYEYLMKSPFDYNAFCFTGCIDLGYDSPKEIKLPFKTIVGSVEFPETITPEQQQLAQVMEKLDQLKNEAEQLQAIINKGKV